MAANPVTSGLVVELDSRSYSGSDNDLVSSWTDQSGNGNNASSSGSNRPTYKTNIINGFPVMRFANKGMSGSVTGGNWAGASGMQIIALMCNFTNSAGFGGAGSVATTGNDHDNASSMIMGGTTGSAGFFGFWQNSNSRFQFRVPNTSSLTLFSCGIESTNFAWGAGNTLLRSSATITVGTSQTNYCVGCRWQSGAIASSFGVTADYCMWLVYDRLLTFANYRLVADWMLSEFSPATGSSRPVNPFMQQVIG